MVQKLESKLADLQQEYDSRQANLSTGQQAAAEAKRLLQSFKHRISHPSASPPMPPTSPSSSIPPAVCATR